MIGAFLLAAAVNVSSVNPRYFETADGKPWIPVGCNICFDRIYDGQAHGDAEVRANFERWLQTFAANGGNCIRLWAGHRSLEVMPDKPGVYDPGRTKTLKEIVGLCERLNVKVKITLESFRSTLADASKASQPFFNRRLYAPYSENVAAFFKSDACRRIYMGKAQYLKSIGLGDSRAVYCWELWNEINSTSALSDYAPWSAWALAELKKMFPDQMTVNNLGSFSDAGAYRAYDELATERGNDFMQVHRYLDAGASLDVCRGAMDVVAASAVREMLDRRPDRPAILAEVGAVEANHTEPFRLYQKDKEGTLLHDALFAAFFAGSAGCGQPWHWDHQYIDGNNLWWHFKRFATAIEGLDPVAEGFRPFYTESHRLKMYGLRGRTVTVIWCRDKQNTWMDELERGKVPETLTSECVPFRNCKLDCYLPWEDRRVSVEAPKLPPFKRSIVVRVPTSAVDGVVRPREWRPKTRLCGFNLLGMFCKTKMAADDKRIMGYFPEDRFRWIRDWGFNFARLPLDYRFFVKEGDWMSLDEAQLKKLDAAVAYGRKYGVHVNIDFHRAPGYCINPPAEPKQLFTDSEPLAAFTNLWATLARRYRGISNDELTFDLVNEPAEINGATQERYVKVAKAAIAAIRAEDPERFVMSDAWAGGNRPAEGLHPLPYNVGESIHPYSPHTVTHFGVKAAWLPQGKECPPWPPKGCTSGRQWFLDNYFAAWKEVEREGCYLHLGEFGTYRKCPHATALAWTEDILAIAKEKGLGWAMWNLDGAFGLLDSDRDDVVYEDFEGHKLDRKMLDLLLKYK